MKGGQGRGQSGIISNANNRQSEPVSIYGNSENQWQIFLMISAIVVVICSSVIGGLVFIDRIKKIENEWDVYATHFSDESIALSNLYSHLGYGGFIHDFKNYIIRQDEELFMKLSRDKHDLRLDLDNYKSNFLVPGMEVEFESLRNVIEQYIEKLELARVKIAEGIRPDELDRLMWVDDQPALEALNSISNKMIQHATEDTVAIRKRTSATIELIVFMLSALVLVVLFLVYVVITVNRQFLKSKMVAEESKDALDGILNSLSDTVISVDEKSNIVWVSGAVKKMFGYEPEELIGLNVKRLIPENARKDHAKWFRGYFANPSPRALGVNNILHALRKGGDEFPIEVSLNTVTMNGMKVAIAAIHDITERIAYERKVEALNHSLIKNNRELNETNKELESFSYSVSHDLRGPLRAIGGFSSLLTEKYKESLDDDAQDYLARIRSSSKRMSELIDSLLNLSRYVREGIEPVDCNLNEIATLVYNRINDAASEPYDAEVEIEGRMHVFADYHLMDVVLYNLMSNALKFTQNTENPRIKVGMFTPEGGQETYFVSDNGEGFDMAYADRLFLPFHRLHQAGQYEGSGIGLATVQRIIRRHGGRVWADSTPGEGTTFYFTLSNPHEDEANHG